MGKRINGCIVMAIALFFIAGCTADNSQQGRSYESQHGNVMELEGLQVHFIDVGQADSTLLEYENDDESYRILIDTGDWNVTTVVDYLEWQEVTELDLVVATHPHADHIGQLAEVIEEFEVTEVWMSGDLTDTQVFERALDAIETNGVDYHEPRAGESYEMGPIDIDVIHPIDVSGNLNNGSISMRIGYRDVSFLFTGDAEMGAEEEMLAGNHELSSTILSIPHHGSDTSSSAAFLEAVEPEVAIYSASEGNSYGHPHESVLANLEAVGADIYGTDRHGTVIIETDGFDVQVWTNEEDMIPPTDATKDGRKTDGCMNINSATTGELEDIIEIGPERAAALIEQRPFDSIDDLTKITGIGDVRLEKIKDQGLACVGGE